MTNNITGKMFVTSNIAIILASYNSFIYCRQVVGDPLCTIFVGRLNPDTNEDTLQKACISYKLSKIACSC